MAHLPARVPPAANTSKSSSSSSIFVATRAHQFKYCPGAQQQHAGSIAARKLARLRRSSSWPCLLRCSKGRLLRRLQPFNSTNSFSSSNQEDEGVENFWEQEEGKKKLGEIEDMKELISEATKLKDDSPQQVQASAASADEPPAADKAQDLRDEIAKRAKEQAERRRQAEKMLQLGQRAYGKGMYDRAVEFFEASLTNIPGSSHLGGEIQVWLAMAYDANGKHAQCIALYKQLESTHPSQSIRRQAKDLRYILEAPKLKISKEEMVSIPLIGENNSETRTWSKMYKERRKKPIKKGPPTKDYMEDWLVWKPPRWERSPYFWVAVTVWLTLVGISLMFQE